MPIALAPERAGNGYRDTTVKPSPFLESAKRLGCGSGALFWAFAAQCWHTRPADIKSCFGLETVPLMGKSVTSLGVHPAALAAPHARCRFGRGTIPRGPTSRPIQGVSGNLEH